VKAAIRVAYGPPEAVTVTEVPRPGPAPNQLLVRVHASTVNRTDCGYRAATPFVLRAFTGLRRPRVTILGCEFAGEVEAVGADVTKFEAGDRVFGYVEGDPGGHAQYLVVAQDASVARIPPNVTFEAAAAATEGAHYALSFIRGAHVRAGQDVLVYGATGAIGSAAVQLLKAMGARVTAVCGTEHVPLVESLGPDLVIDYQAQDFTRHGLTYDVVIDAVGKSTFGACRRLLRSGAIYLSSELGPRGQNIPLSLVSPLMRGQRRVVFPFPKHDQAMIEELRDLLASGAFQPVIDRRYSLDQIVEAYRYVETGQKVGNVVIEVP
jgi:NADPH:quinone reductase-like Zn-dependent oxidoreductase